MIFKGFRLIKRGGQRCYFCCQKPLLNPNSFCPDCGQFNGFDNSTPSGLSRQIPELSCEELNKPSSCQTEEYRPASEDLFCNKCLANMELHRTAIAGLDDNLGDDDLDRQLQIFEREYAVCEICHHRAQRHLETIDVTAKEMYAAVLVSRSRDSRTESVAILRPASGQLAASSRVLQWIDWIVIGGMIILETSSASWWPPYAVALVVLGCDCMGMDRYRIVIDVALIVLMSMYSGCRTCWMIGRLVLISCPLMIRRMRIRWAGSTRGQEPREEFVEEVDDEELIINGLAPALANVQIEEARFSSVGRLMKALSSQIALFSSRRLIGWAMQWRVLCVPTFCLLIFLRIFGEPESLRLSCGIAALAIVCQRLFAQLTFWSNTRGPRGYRFDDRRHVAAAVNLTALLSIIIINFKLFIFDFLPAFNLDTLEWRLRMIYLIRTHTPDRFFDVPRVEYILATIGLLWLGKLAMSG